MDDFPDELEAELKALRPRRPTLGLRGRIQGDLAAGSSAAAPSWRTRYATATNLKSWKWSGWKVSGLAAALALAVGLGGLVSLRQAAPTGLRSLTQVASPLATAPQAKIVRPDRPVDRYQAVAAANVLYDLQDEGLAKADDPSGGRRVRYRYVDTYTWKDPRTNASLKWSVPRDEIRLVAASLN